MVAWPVRYRRRAAPGVARPQGAHLLFIYAERFDYDWHLANIRNYLNLSTVASTSLQVRETSVTALGQGGGIVGIPGDYTPPSRFVRAVAFSQSVLPSKTGDDAVLEAFHILNQFDIPKGAARDREKDSNGNVIADYTLWTAASDLKQLR